MSRGSHPPKSHHWIIPLAAALTVLPLLLFGGSCGHDLLFHVQSWIDAAQQLSQGHYPHWASTPAWNTGEPRFIFYPPLSWLLGAVLTAIFPIAATPAIFIFIVLLASGLAFHRLARHFVAPRAALIASAFYLANPYMLFCAFERSSLAELLAATWIPLLLLAALRQRPTVRSIAVALALLWLTNAPAAVIGSYALALIALLRIAAAFLAARRGAAVPTLASAQNVKSAVGSVSTLHLAINYVFGTILGLALAAFYILPAAYQRRFVQIDMARIPDLRPQDNFLFTHTADTAHNAVNHSISLLALTLLCITAATLLFVWLRPKKYSGQPRTLTATTEPAPSHLHLVHPQLVLFYAPPPRYVVPILAIFTATIALLLTPVSQPIWQHLPELAFLQFPWRLLGLLAPVLALAVALALDTILSPTTYAFATSSRDSLKTASIVSAAVSLLLGLICFHLYRQPCDPDETPAALAHNLATHHGTLPTDEYTPIDADNNLLRSDNPAFWLIAGSDPNIPAPHTAPTATELNPAIDTDDTPIPLAQTVSTPAPHHLTLNLAQPRILVLNLRDYPCWRVTDLNMPALPPHLHRADGLIAIQLPAGRATIEIAWRHTLDQLLGIALSIVALIALLLPTATRRRRAHHAAPEHNLA